ncbi:iron-containing alcohol dehydrogenase [Streptomyces sp. NPDC059009]|uniref:iron-containing alcohol dehydrogenase n=1 Tax=Streptomyces sp. NPDC059009 TaxID=3346694 RepID=UPI003683C285
MSEHQPLSGRFDMLPMESMIYGAGTVDQAGAECERLGMTRIFLVLSASLGRASDIESRLRAQLGDRIAVVFTGSEPHAPEQVVLDAAAQAREAGVDGFLAVGGGSPIDIAKAVNLCLTEKVTTREALLKYAVKFTYPDQLEIPSMTGEGLPQVVVSTTLSAAEFTHITAVTDTVDLVKNLYLDNALMPEVVIHDSELQQFTPRQLWAATGMRAVDHCIESLCSTRAQPVTDALCTDGLRRLATYLPISASDASDTHAAGECQMGAWQSAFGITQVFVGLSHGIGHQLGARHGIPHGVTSCVMLPTVLAYNYECTQEQQTHIARVMADSMGVPVPQDGASGIVRQFIGSLGLPTTLREVGVTPDDFPLIARDAMQDFVVANNPRPVQGTADVIEILEQAY